ncbi:MAG: tRNA 4-thiouridine(8) synthase ThiI [Clostridiaceae bacterium]|nr:tRNA 4-thiouridine(8) synthase ThiI [Clostridiaceae bacterium]
MKKVILIRYGEIMLKGLNRPFFENTLIENIKKVLRVTGKSRIKKKRGRIYVEPEDEGYDVQAAINRLKNVFGIMSVSPAFCVDNEFNEIKKCALQVAKEAIDKGTGTSFKVETKRENKKFYMDSPEINRELGRYLLMELPVLKVDVNNPSFVVNVEVRDLTYIYTELIKGYGGLPVGTGGKAMLLLSGGIDSPVAGWMMAKRGIMIEAVHFHSYPYTSERSKEKVIELVKILSLYCHNIDLHVVPFTNIQLEISEKCPHDMITIIMRRMMMKIAGKLAESTGSMALITGESLGQVASQTLQSLLVTNAATNMLVFRPLVGMDKNEVVDIARNIGTYETSILPYEDCCTLFVAKHPETKPRLEKVLIAESRLDIDKLVKEAMEGTETISISYG